MPFYKDPKIDRWFIRAKYALYTFNVLYLLLGIVVLTMAIYIRAEWTIKHYIYELDAYLIWTGPYILMASSSLTIILSLAGCWGAVHELPFFLFLFTVLTGLAALLGLIGVTYSLNRGTLFSSITPWLTDRFTYLVFQGAYDIRAARIVRIIQNDLGCCGGSGWADYFDNQMTVPHECRSQITGNMHVFGCGIVFSEFLQPLMGWMSGFALLLIVFQLMGMFVAMFFRRQILATETVVGSTTKKPTYRAVSTRQV